MQYFDVESNQADELWTQSQLIERLKGKQGVVTTGSERIDATVLVACSSLKICAHMAVGFNNFDIDALTERPAGLKSCAVDNQRVTCAVN